MALDKSSIPAALEDVVRRRRDEIAYTFIDYEIDPAGLAESVTYAEVLERVQTVAAELSRCGAPGDRAVILAPQSLDYVVGFLGAIQAGMIAVPLSVPFAGTHDERVSGVLQDCMPTAILTTSSAVDEVLPYAARLGRAAPSVIEVDALGIDSSPRGGGGGVTKYPAAAYLQYTSGSTRSPAGVVVSHRNVIVNFQQIIPAYFAHHGGDTPAATTFVSWLPFYHDMGLLIGVFAPIMLERPSVFMSPLAFLQKPARWMQQLALNSSSWSAGPNFAFELAARRTSDEDLAGLDLSDILTMASGGERIHAATLRRFTERFAKFNLPETTLRPSYGLAEATLFVSTSTAARAPVTVRFDLEKLSAGYAERCESESGTELVGNGAPLWTTVRIVDPETGVENPAERVGEIWVHGENVAGGYWRNPQVSERTFGARLVDPSPGTPQGPWLRTGDLGVMSGGELFIIGRIKDLLIVDGVNHYPDDIEATIQEITGGRAVAISVPDEHTEQLVAIAEVKKHGSGEEGMHRLRSVKREVASAIRKTHSVRVADLVLVPPGSIPITTSGKVRRSACAERYRQDEFARLEVSA